MSAAKNNPPHGFSLSFSRHKRSWGWKDQYPDANAAYDRERFGFLSRREANADAHAEAGLRARAKAGLVRFEATTKTWHASA